MATALLEKPAEVADYGERAENGECVLKTLAEEFDFVGSPKALDNIVETLRALEFALEQLARAVVTSEAVLMRSEGFVDELFTSRHQNAPRSELPTITHETVGRLVAFLGHLDDYLGSMKEHADSIRRPLPELALWSEVADREGPLDEIVADIERFKKEMS
jgi:hypothetical protein